MNMCDFIEIFSFFFLLSFSNHVLCSLNQNQNERNTCPQPYSLCNPGIEGMLNVHIVPHTHNDVGWLKTVDEYFYGSSTSYQKAGVQYILDTVVQELSKDPNKRFVYVEIAFFWMWWNQQDNSTKQMVRTFVANGQLEFVIGGWCMNDEATTYYNDIIDQQTEGLQFILREFGECARPRVAWQLDPFGHSREQASLFAQFGFDGLFLGRIDYQDDSYKSKTKTREMIWQASSSLGNYSTIFTGVLPNIYNPPPGFCFDDLCSDEPIMDDPNLENYNVDDRVKAFISYINTKAKVYKTNNLILTMGSDFQYSNARMWYKNLDKLIYHVNQLQKTGNSSINVFYSTPSCYLNSLHKANITWPTKQDDFFPYAHRPYSFWTGYYTSRTTLKSYVRRTNNYMQAVRQLGGIAKLTPDIVKDPLGNLARAMGVAQHHDAVSGTEKQHVARDYAKRLAIGTEISRNVITNAYASLLVSIDSSLRNFSLEYYDQQFCPLLNISECLAIENKESFTVVIYNPLARNVESHIRLPVFGSSYIVKEAASGIVQSADIIKINDDVKSIPERKSNADHEVVFTTVIPALGFRIFNVSLNSKTSSEQPNSIPDSVVFDKKEKTAKADFTIKNGHLQLEFDANGMLHQVSTVNTKNVISSNIEQRFCYYDSFTGFNIVPELQSSGAYIFRPELLVPTCFDVQSFEIYQGQFVQEVHQIYSDWLSQTIRLYNNSKHVEFEWQVGPIPVFLLTGKEVVTQFKTDLRTNKTFYTDANGREILKRVRDFRPGWEDFKQTEEVAGNYYPVNSRIFIRDEDSNARQVTVVTDRSHGASSINDGEIEIMLHRRILSDDALGVGEPLDELGVNLKGLIARGKHYLFLNTTQDSPRLHRDLAHKVNMQPLLTFPKYSNQLAASNLNLYKVLDGWQSIKQSLPENVELITLMQDFYSSQPFNYTLIVRFEHFYEANEDPQLSLPATINISAIFDSTFQVNAIQELALGANMDVSELNNRLVWNPMTRTDRETLPSSQFYSKQSPFVITLQPMQIRTFRIWYQQ